MERSEYHTPREYQPSNTFSEGASLEKHGVIAQITDRLYLVMATKINGGETPLTSIPVHWLDPKRERYDIQIRGDKQFTQATQQALDLLQNRGSDFYDFVTQNIGMIQQVEKGSGMQSRTSIPVFLASKKTNVLHTSSQRYASNLVHEAWHSYRYSIWLRTHPEASDALYSAWLRETLKQQETGCLILQYGALVRLKASPVDLLDIKTTIKSPYWEVPYEKRYW